MSVANLLFVVTVVCAAVFVLDDGLPLCNCISLCHQKHGSDSKNRTNE